MHGETRSLVGGRARAGSLTAVMRAAATPGPRVLRLGWVEGGRLIEERILRRGAVVTVGPEETNLFVARADGLPDRFPLLEPSSHGYSLTFLEWMEGKLLLDEGVADLSSLKDARHALRGGGYRIQLGPESRGKIVIGSATFLFQFVVPPPAQSRPALPVSVIRGGGSIDWKTTIIAATSLLLHFFLIGSAYSDWLDPVIDDDVVAAGLVDSVVPFAMPVVEVPDEHDQVQVPSTEPTKPAAPSPDRASGGIRARPDGATTEAALSRALLTSMETVGALHSSGAATEDVLRDGEVPMAELDAAARSNTGVGFGLHLEGGADRVRPGEHGSELSTLGNTSGLGGRGLGASRDFSGPHGRVEASRIDNVGGRIEGAARVIAGLRGSFRNCYNHALAENPDVEGKIELSVKVGPGGGVQSVGAVPSGNLPASLVACVRSRVSRAEFEPPAGGMALVQVPVNFVKQ